jgi:pimeloyl-ACP methyl ester carboxylesterase
VQLIKINTIFTGFKLNSAKNQALETRFIAYKNSRIRCLGFGRGARPVLCFHGYGEQAGLFSFLEEAAGNEYRFYAVDLPFHGETEWNEGLDFHWKDLRDIIKLLPQTFNIEPYTLNSPTLMGFSLGGRVALSLYQAMPEKIEKLILLAPDGLKVNFWYWLSTQTWPGKALFRFTMKHPGWFFGLLKMQRSLKLVNASVIKFVNYYIDDRSAREVLYNRWISLRRLRPNLEKIKKEVEKFETPVRLLYGKHDRIILPSRGEKFRRGIEPYCSINIIPSGHQLLHEKHAKEIVETLKA